MTATGTWRAVVRLACGERKRKTAPDGQISVRAQKLSSPSAKNISLNPSGDSGLSARPVLSRQEGALRGRHERGRGCGGRGSVGRGWFTGRLCRENDNAQDERRFNASARTGGQHMARRRV